MRAVIHTRYGGPEVLHLAEIERPAPAADEILIRVYVATVNRTDCGMRSASPFIVRYFSGLRRPKRQILGSEYAGEVEAVGASVTEFAVGDRVFGVNADRMGANAEYLCVKEASAVATMPAGLGFDEAAATCDGAIIALTCLRNAGLQAGQRILVYGASGAIGTAAVQLAKHMGAHVIAVCDTRNVQVVSGLGPDAVIDYTTDDFTANGEVYDVVFDAVGKHSFRRCRSSVAAGGTFASTDLGFMWHVPILALLTRRIGSKRVMLPIPVYHKANVQYLKGVVEAGGFRPVIDRRYRLDEAVEATRYVETGQKTGNVVLTVAG